MSDGQRYFFFGITVSEIAFILFFVLLLFTFVQVASLENGKKLAEKKMKEAQKSATDAKIIVDEMEKFLKDGNDIIMDDPLTAMKKALDAIKNSAAQADRITNLEAENKKLLNDKRDANRLVQSTQQQSRHLKGQVANLQKQAGVGLPPCWVTDESGNIEFLFRVTLFGDESVNVKREAPLSREKDYLKLPSVPEITGRKLSMEDFRRLARPIYDIGSSSDPVCRHFVKVQFADRESCRLLLIVENFFYKIVELSDATICTG